MASSDFHLSVLLWFIGESRFGAGDMVAATQVAQAEVVMITEVKLMGWCYILKEEKM